MGQGGAGQRAGDRQANRGTRQGDRQANRDTRPHLIGGHGDFVWPTGKFHTPPDVDQETWFIPGGTAGAAVYTFHQPGVYAYVNHNLIEAFEFGAAGHFVVEGEWNDDLMMSVLAPSPI